jgi:outer membrane protein OmpA-like peptidoglycan-associated protein
MSGDIFFEPNIQRTIVCDIRYILWIIEKCYGAQNLIDEMEIRQRPSNDDEENQVSDSTAKNQSTSIAVCSLFKTEDVLFDLGRYDVSAKNTKAIDDVVKILKDNTNVTVELNGHTDLTGDVCKNLILSEKRAKSVQKYLVSKGIDSKRIITKGFGTAQPKDENKTEEGRAHNRRVSFSIK